MKKFISALLSAAILLTAGAGAVACDDGAGGGGTGNGEAKYKYDITVWVGEETKGLTEKLISDFNASNTNGIRFNATVNEVTEGRAAGDILSKPADAPEIFCFVQDQIARLVESKLLAQPGATVTKAVKAAHSDTSVAAATVGSTMFAYPLTEDNGYFLYYDTRVISAEQAGKVETIITQCENAGKRFSVNLTGDGGGWYTSSFFYATGAKSEWTTTDLGKFDGYEDTFDSAEGLIAAKGMGKILWSSCYDNSGKASSFNSAIPSAAVVSGVWDYTTAKNALGDNLGIAKLPTFTVDEKDYQLKSYLGCKLLGVTPQSDANKAAALSLLAQYLTNADSQLKRFEQLGWGPSEKTAQQNEKVKSNAALAALKAPGATVPQGQYPANWWSKVQVLSGSIENAKGSETALKTALSIYKNGLASLIE